MVNFLIFLILLYLFFKFISCISIEIHVPVNESEEIERMNNFIEEKTCKKCNQFYIGSKELHACLFKV